MAAAEVALGRVAVDRATVGAAVAGVRVGDGMGGTDRVADGEKIDVGEGFAEGYTVGAIVALGAGLVAD